MGPLIRKMQDFGNYILDECLPGLKKIAEMNYERMVFLDQARFTGLHMNHT